jgi:5'-nucleotidase (lipoprotein e(P4) family)
MTVASMAMITLSLSVCSSQAVAPEHAKSASPPQVRLGDQQVMADLWYQTSGEAKALYYQGYHIGKMKLDTALANRTTKKPAVVLDLDETVLDNSPYRALLSLSGKSYPNHWNDWVNRAEAAALPGAVYFLRHADANGVDIFYISNRKRELLDATIKNLKKIGAPQASKDHVLLQQPHEKGKGTRLKRVAQSHEILLYFGDNLSDFPGFEGKLLADRNRTVEQLKNQFAERFILFPNPMYGDWEGALYQFNYAKSDQEKDRLRKNNLQVFKP